MNIKRAGRKGWRPEHVDKGGGVISAWTRLSVWASVAQDVFRRFVVYSLAGIITASVVVLGGASPLAGITVAPTRLVPGVFQLNNTSRTFSMYASSRYLYLAQQRVRLRRPAASFILYRIRPRKRRGRLSLRGIRIPPLFQLALGPLRRRIYRSLYSLLLRFQGY